MLLNVFLDIGIILAFIKETNFFMNENVKNPKKKRRTKAHDEIVPSDEKQSLDESKKVSTPKEEPIIEEISDVESCFEKTFKEDTESKDDNKLERKLDREKKKNTIFLLTIIILLLLLGSCSAFYLKKKNECKSCVMEEDGEVIEVDPNQGKYASEEAIETHNRLIAMPGWVSFTIPANSLSITQGFEFHNPASNSWYEDTVTINGIETETFIVGEDEIKLDHLLRIVGIKNTVKSVVSYDSTLFKVELGSDNQYFIKGLNGFEGTQEVVIELANGEEATLSITSKNEFYYMSFGLYIEGEDSDELIYQSGLVEPGMYIQRMELNKALKSGTYDAYVLCQPYKSDAKTKTNNGVVKLTLYAA